MAQYRVNTDISPSQGLQFVAGMLDLQQSKLNDIARLLDDVDGGFLGFMDNAIGDWLMRLPGEAAMAPMARQLKTVAAAMPGLRDRLSQEHNTYSVVMYFYNDAEQSVGTTLATITVAAISNMAQSVVDNVKNIQDAVSRTTSYKDVIYTTVPNLDAKYFYNQTDYRQFEKDHGGGDTSDNEGCTVTSEAIAWSIYHNETLTPDKVGWNSDGATWSHSDSVNISDSELYSTIYNNVINGKPMIIRV
jgi:hypothetical protein